MGVQDSLVRFWYSQRQHLPLCSSVKKLSTVVRVASKLQPGTLLGTVLIGQHPLLLSPQGIHHGVSEEMRRWYKGIDAR